MLALPSPWVDSGAGTKAASCQVKTDVAEVVKIMFIFLGILRILLWGASILPKGWIWACSVCFDSVHSKHHHAEGECMNHRVLGVEQSYQHAELLAMAVAFAFGE